MADVTPGTIKTSTKETTSGTTTSTSGHTSVKPTHKKKTATASASSQSAKDKSVSDTDLQSNILEALNNTISFRCQVYGTCYARFGYRRDTSRLWL
ncbi:hypothetical protein DPMN_039779 [Dreissena polymorpha]|uniref:Uncharacterized protein n=1 Tax=Dreissena polymorpha TaxID=45954 RepID=A0A9D4CWV3_DREPO|nr:hypothetical protein DPMN_039779 [Dreissena polymorpha]